MRSDVVAIVPAGGAARRLGPRAPGGKAALVAAGRTFLARIAAVLADEVSQVIVVAAPGDEVPAVPPGVEVIRDAAPGAGPLAAVRDGLRHALAASPPPRVAVICACDAPLIVPGVIRLLIARVAAPGVRWALPVVGDRPQPFPSALAADVLPAIEEELARGRGGFRDLAAALGRADPRGIAHVAAAEIHAVDAALDSFRDVDTPEDLGIVVRRASERPRGG